ncbi:MAG: ribonuclease III, partial [Patescibacteria group bacterium]
MKNINHIKESFKDKALFDQALTHRSWVNENKNVRESNERLEFLGDAILEHVVSYDLFKKFPDKAEGYLTTLRANLVNTKNLFHVARDLGLGEHLFLSKGEEESGGRTNESLLADTLEALIGAIYIDQGFPAASDFIDQNIISHLSTKLHEPLKDPKSRLQEKVQATKLPAPVYKVISAEGPDHSKLFKVVVEVEKNVIGTGEGKNKAE